MGFDGHDPNAVNERVVIDLCGDEADLDISRLDVEVDDEIDFEVRGRIENLDDRVLGELSGRSVTPAEIHFCTRERPD